jgi:uncharacterized protein
MGDQKVPVGFGRDGNPVYLNFEFVDGTRGAHISISGVSGIATKTSFALFLLHSIVNCGVLAAEAHNTKMLVFSVKGEDLLFLDYANARLNQEDREKYSRLGLPATPFQNVRVFAPPRPGDQSGTPDVQARDKAVSPFYWTLAEFCQDEPLDFGNRRPERPPGSGRAGDAWDPISSKSVIAARSSCSRSSLQVRGPAAWAAIRESGAARRAASADAD